MRNEDRQAYESLAASQNRLSSVLERAELRASRERDEARREKELTELRPFRKPDRPYDVLGRQVIRPMPVASFLVGIPGLAGQFGKEVPATHLDGDKVSCTCGETVELTVALVSCECTRFFLRAGARVMVAGPYGSDSASSDEVEESEQAA